MPNRGVREIEFSNGGVFAYTGMRLSEVWLYAIHLIRLYEFPIFSSFSKLMNNLSAKTIGI